MIGSDAVTGPDRIKERIKERSRKRTLNSMLGGGTLIRKSLLSNRLRKLSKNCGNRNLGTRELKVSCYVVVDTNLVVDLKEKPSSSPPRFKG